MASILFLSLAVLLLLKVAAIELIDPPGGYEFAVGEPTTIRWKPVASNGTVTLEFMWGAAIASDDGDVIACTSYLFILFYLTEWVESHLYLCLAEIPDSGRFTWTPPDDVKDFDNYTICIYPDQPPQNFDCLPIFSIDGAGESKSKTSPSATPSSSPTSTPEPTPSEDSNPDDTSDGLTTAAKAGIGIGGGVGVVVVVVFIGFCWMRRRKQTTPGDQSFPLTSHPNPSMTKNAHGSTMELHSNASRPNVNELVSNSVGELHGMQQYPTELSGSGLRELDGDMRRAHARPPIELPAMERRFV